MRTAATPPIVRPIVPRHVEARHVRWDFLILVGLGLLAGLNA